MGNFTLQKAETVRAKKVIEALFAKTSKSMVAYSFRFSWILVEPNENHCAVLFISSKKKLKLAVDRNRRKRLLRELYRLNKLPLLDDLKSRNQSIALSLNYVGADTLNMQKHDELFKKALNKLILELQKNHTSTVPLAH
jgi:ribonuclease P protein component